MADSSIELNPGSGGAKLATHQQTRGAETVEIEEVVLGHPTEDRQVLPNADGSLPTSEVNPGVSFATGTASSTGDTTAVAAPGAGTKLRLHLLHATPDNDNSAFPRIIWKGSGGTEIFRGGAIQHSRYYIDLPENEALVINLDAAQSVYWTCHYTTESV